MKSVRLSIAQFKALSPHRKAREMGKLIARLKASEGIKGFRRDPLQIKAQRVKLLQDLQEDGKVALLSSGMDCDGASWENRHHGLYPALYWVVFNAIDAISSNCEARIEVWVESPSEAAAAEYGERDLALEAFENGHPHLLIEAD